MKTEIVKLIEAMHSGDEIKEAAFLDKLQENYHKYYENDIFQKVFPKRVLNIFYPDDERYKSSYACMDSVPDNEIKEEISHEDGTGDDSEYVEDDIFINDDNELDIPCGFPIEH